MYYVARSDRLPGLFILVSLRSLLFFPFFASSFPSPDFAGIRSSLCELLFSEAAVLHFIKRFEHVWHGSVNMKLMRENSVNFSGSFHRNPVFPDASACACQDQGEWPDCGSGWDQSGGCDPKLCCFSPEEHVRSRSVRKTHFQINLVLVNLC